MSLISIIDTALWLLLVLVAIVLVFCVGCVVVSFWPERRTAPAPAPESEFGSSSEPESEFVAPLSAKRTYTRLNPHSWVMNTGGERSTVECPECGTVRDLSLTWHEGKEQNARFSCPNCGHVWWDQRWATVDVTRQILNVEDQVAMDIDPRHESQINSAKRALIQHLRDEAP